MSKHIPKYAWVAVTAIDWTHTSHEQLDEDEAMDLSPVGVRIAGHLIKDGDNFVTLASQVFEDGTYRHLVSVPTGCILELIQLQPAAQKEGPGPYAQDAAERLSSLLGVIPADMSRLSREDALDAFRALQSISRDLEDGWVDNDGEHPRDKFTGGME